MTYRGGATLAWQSDYCQFYLQNDGASGFEAPVDITPDMMRRRWHVVPNGLVVYTNDCLKQLIEVRIFSAAPAMEPMEWRSQRIWTQTETAEVGLPLNTFALSSPSRAGLERYGPLFRVDATQMTVCIQWMEHGASDDTASILDDVIRLTLWPVL